MNRASYFLLILFITVTHISTLIHAHAQRSEDIRDIERSLSKLEGVEKLVNLNILTKYYIIDNNSQKTNRYAKQAAELAESLYLSDQSLALDDKISVVSACSQYGEILFNQGDYRKSKTYFSISHQLSAEMNFQRGKSFAEVYITKIDSLDNAGLVKENFFDRTFKDINIGDVISETTTGVAISSELQLARMKENKGKTEESIAHYENAIELLKKKGDSDKQIEEIESKISILKKSIADDLAKNDTQEDKVTGDPISAKFEEQKKEEPLNVNTSVSPEIMVNEARALRDLALDFEARKDYEKSLEYYKMYLNLEKRIQEDSLHFLAELELSEQEFILLSQQKEIADLNIKAIQSQNEQQAQIMEVLTAGGLSILLATLVILFLYFGKKKQHRQLTVAYTDLDQTRHELVNAEKKISTLLKQQVSGEIANELIQPKNQGKMKFVCVMFLDIRDFTPRAEQMTPEQLIEYQNKIFGFMIDKIEHYHGNINQIMGDGFMATFGAPKSYGNDCRNAFLAAREILEEVDKKNLSGEIPITQVGIGLHAGNVVTGNVGTDVRKQYSVTGSTVIIASRVEQLNKKYKSRLIITEEVYKYVKEDINKVIKMIEVNVKGRTEPVRILKVT